MTAYAVLLIPAACLLLFLIFAGRNSREQAAAALVKTHLVVFAFIAASTELLSAFHVIRFKYLATAWLLLCAGLAAGLLFRPAARQGIKDAASRLKTAALGLSRTEMELLYAIVFLLACSLATALIYPPLDWDSMTYHMSRVAHWAHQGSVDFYPTPINRQNFNPPLSEFAMLHWQLLSQSDRFANLVQWFSFVAAIAATALIAAELGLGRLGQYASAFLAATLPMGILQSTNTQNDMVVAGFVLAFAYFLLRLQRGASAGDFVFASMSLGAAMLTKGTAYVYCAAVGLALALPALLALRRSPQAALRRTGAYVALIVAALLWSAPFYARTHDLYGTFLSTAGGGYSNDSITPAIVFSNLIRNVALHCSLPSDDFNAMIYDKVVSLLGAQADNLASTWGGGKFAMFYIPNDALAGNPLHMLLIFVAFVGAPFYLRKSGAARLSFFVAAVAAGLLYCACLKWQIWGSRLQTPLFMLWIPIVVMAYLHFSRRAFFRGFACLAAVLAAIIGIWRASDNPTRSLRAAEWNAKPRAQLYFNSQPHLFGSYRQVMLRLQNFSERDVGLYIGGDDYEYPLWAMGKVNQFAFRHVGVTDVSKKYLKDQAPPPWVFCTRNPETFARRADYDIAYSDENICLLVLRSLNADGARANFKP